MVEDANNHNLSQKWAPFHIAFYRWKKQFTGLEVDQVRQLKRLQDENGRLKKLVAELTLDRAMLQDVLRKTGEALTAPRPGWIPVRRVPVSERHACEVVLLP